jgi:hypothetical protein
MVSDFADGAKMLTSYLRGTGTEKEAEKVERNNNTKTCYDERGQAIRQDSDKSSE